MYSRFEGLLTDTVHTYGTYGTSPHSDRTRRIVPRTKSRSTALLDSRYSSPAGTRLTNHDRAPSPRRSDLRSFKFQVSLLAAPATQHLHANIAAPARSGHYKVLFCAPARPRTGMPPPGTHARGLSKLSSKALRNPQSSHMLARISCSTSPVCTRPSAAAVRVPLVAGTPRATLVAQTVSEDSGYRYEIIYTNMCMLYQSTICSEQYE